jgi:hypothetical protein
MQSVKPIVLGALAGLGLGLAALAGLYASPLRQDLYFSADPSLADARSRLETYQEWLNQADARIALQGPESDSLRSEQERVWRDYKAWRTRVGQMARLHAQPSGRGFLDWTYSLRYWDAPGAAAAMLLCALAGFLSARNRFRPSRTRGGKASRSAPAAPGAPASEARSRALSEFEEAVKKVARISRPDPQPIAEPPPTDLLPIPGTVRAEPGLRSREPDTKPLPQTPPGEPPVQGDGRETRLFQVPQGWGESPEAPPPGGLSMEDEDGPGNTDATLGVMPPTTEVERVERRKEEVLKLARKGMTSSEISRRLRISQDQVEVIIRMRREKG